MAVMSTTPVFFCRHCGRPVTMKLKSYNDPDGARLHSMMKGLHKVAVCKPCKARLQYHQRTGSTDFRLGPTNAKVIRVIDPRNTQT